MNNFNKILSLFLVFTTVQTTTPAVFAQNLAGRVTAAPTDTSRITGSSFGSKGTTTLPTPGVGTQEVFHEPTYSGLTYQVHILGEVGSPGTYRVTASTRLSEALDKAGGVSGSARRIELRRTDGGSRIVDLRRFKKYGNLDDNPYLLDNDVVYVPRQKFLVQVMGTVKEPGTYELLPGERTLEKLFKMVGGFSPGISPNSPIKVIRFANSVKEVLNVENTLDAFRNFRLQNADVVVAPHFLTDKKKFDYNLASLPGDNRLFYPSYDERVHILGAVSAPGPYPFSPYYEVRQYLTLAGGTTKLAKSRKLKIIHSDGKTERANNTSSINPGDTIIVPERYMAPESFVTLALGVTASILGITSAIITLK